MANTPQDPGPLQELDFKPEPGRLLGQVRGQCRVVGGVVAAGRVGGVVDFEELVELMLSFGVGGVSVVCGVF